MGIKIHGFDARVPKTNRIRDIMMDRSLAGETHIDVLEHRDALLEAVCKIVSSLLSTDSWEVSLYETFPLLAETLDVNWIGLYQNTEDASGNNAYRLVVTSCSLERDVDQCNMNVWEKFCRFPHFANMREQLEGDIVLTGCAIGGDPELRELFCDLGVLSILAIPVFVKS